MIRRLTAAMLMLFLLAGCSGPGATPPEQTPSGPGPAPVDKTPASPAAYDLVIRGGTIMDGSGAAAFRGDIGIQGDKIVAVGNLGQHTAAREMDATGLVVAPGFINPHSHTHDFINPFEDYDTTASLKQGITTEIGGVDGRSPLPIGTELDRIGREGTGVNFGLFAGQGSIREQVMGKWTRGVASPEQLDQMKRMTRQAMEEGAFGISTGLEYAAGMFAAQQEITALVAETKPYGGIYSTHIRNEGAEIIEAVQEALAIAKTAGVPLNLSHFKIVGHANWGKEEQLVRLVEQAISQGQKVFADVYPYEAPDYAVNRPLEEWVQRLPADYIFISKASNPALTGKTLADAAKVLNLPLAQATEQLKADPGLAVVALVNSERAMIRFYQAPWSVVSTDGESQPKLGSAAEALAHAMHRRSYGSYPRLLGEYVREKQILSLEQMIRKMSGQVADSLVIPNRGYLKPGYFADIVVFDPKTVADRTTWLSPQEYPAGIKHVLVNGQVAIQNGERQPGRPGRIIRHSAGR